MKRLLLTAYLIFTVIFLMYLLPASPEFPEPPPNSPQSGEPADTETPLRRAYFTDFTREEVMSHYKNQFQSIYTLNFNYPPEEAQTIIRDQTRSWYLEELSHPFRESVYINGFIPQTDNEVILRGDRNFYQKITIRYVPTTFFVRLSSGIGVIFSLFLTGYCLQIFTPRIPIMIKNITKLFL